MAAIIDARIRAARAQSPLLTIEWYCRGACPAREITVRIKDYDTELLAQGRQVPTCPLCGSVLVLHDVHTDVAQAAADNRAARAAVNVQMYIRDRGPVIPGTVIGDDRLPPTPPGWWDDLAGGQR